MIIGGVRIGEKRACAASASSNSDGDAVKRRSVSGARAKNDADACSGSDSEEPAEDLDDAARFTFSYGPPMLTPPRVHRGDHYRIRAAGMWSVPLAQLVPEDVAAHLEALKCVPNGGKTYGGGGGAGRGRRFGGGGGKKEPGFNIGAVSGGFLYMPPWYARAAFPDAVHTADVALTAGEALRPGVAFTGTLLTHPPQQQAAARYAAWLAEGDNAKCPCCILSMPCGYGKTVTWLAIMASLNRVGLVLAHTTPLVDQWIEEARAFLGPAARVGYVRDGGDVRVDGVDLVVASIQSLLIGIRKAAPWVARLWARVGTVVLDEGHHAVACTFWEVLAACPAAHRFVLTATPRRKDGLLPQLQWVAGPVIFRAHRRRGDVFALAVKYVNPAFVELKDRFGNVNMAAMLNALAEDAGRNAAIARIAAQLVLTQGRRVLVVTPRVQQVHDLAAAITALLTDGGVAPRTATLFVPDRCPVRRSKPRGGETAEDAEARYLAARHEWEDAGLHGSTCTVSAPLVGTVLSGMKTLDRYTHFEGHVVIATMQIMEEGVSYKQWDTLINVGTSSDAEQVVGRIQRQCATKRVPLVIDVWTDVSLLKGLFYKRRSFYVAEGFSLQYVTIDGEHALPAFSAATADGATFWSKFDRPAPAVM